MNIHYHKEGFMYTHICQICGNSFQAVHKARKYCSRNCYSVVAGKSKRRFTDEEEVQICNEYNQQLPNGVRLGAPEIADKWETNHHTIYRIIKKYGFETRPRGETNKGRPSPKLTRIPPEGETAPLCKCGCGQPVEWLRQKDRWARYIKGHYTQKGEQNQRWNGGFVKLICEQCSKEYEVEPHKVKRSRYCSPDCMGIAKRSPHYEGRERWIKWNAVRARIRKRDNWTCQKCGFYGKGIKRAIHVHHKDENPTNNKDDNLICLCARCHLKAHGCDLPDDWEYDGIEFP
jgi:hypothetical protein